MVTDLNMEMRRKLLNQGRALPPKQPGGPPRFPIRHAGDVEDGVGLVGQVADSEKPKVRRHLIRNAKKVPGGMAKIPDNWLPNGQLSTGS
jgi:hypothetical protein